MMPSASTNNPFQSLSPRVMATIVSVLVASAALMAGTEPPLAVAFLVVPPTRPSFPPASTSHRSSQRFRRGVTDAHLQFRDCYGWENRHICHHSSGSKTSPTRLSMIHERDFSSSPSSRSSSRVRGRKNVRIPLLVLTDEDDESSSDDTKRGIRPIVFPMPSGHLPAELSTLNLYGTEVVSPAHVRLIAEAGRNEERSYGHVVWRRPGPTPVSSSTVDDDEEAEGGGNDLVGAIGCACRIIVDGPSSSPSSLSSARDDGSDDGSAEDEPAAGGDEVVEEVSDKGSSPPVSVLVRGSFRFVVREIESVFPYPIAVVDELLDDDEEGDDGDDDAEAASGVVDEGEDDDEDDEDNVEHDDDEDDDDDDDDDDDEDDTYERLTPSELTTRCLDAMRALVRIGLDEAERAAASSSPLEAEIASALLGRDGGPTPSEVSRANAEERAAVLEVFMTELVEMTDVVFRRYAIGMMAAEIGDLSFEQRRDALVTTDGVERLRVILPVLESKISMERAKAMAQQLTKESNDDQRQLKVGTPTLPGWSNQIKPGIKVEYYWNEEYEWCAGTVRDTMKVVDELIVTVEFEDGSIHKIPFTAEEKARWRPAS